MTEKQKMSPIIKFGGGFILFCVLLVILAKIGIIPTEEKPKLPPKKETALFVNLNAVVQFSGTQFIITNNDSFDWSNVELEINPGMLKSGYKLNAKLMSAGQTYTVGAMQFAKPDGTRFNPFSIKPQSISISCNTQKGKGFYSGKWN